MKLSTRGKAIGIDKPIVATITRDPQTTESHKALLCEGNFVENRSVAFTLTGKNTGGYFPHIRHIHSTNELNYLEEGDIIVANSDGVINTLYRVNSHHNSLLVTERCNSNCLMCSQPPRDRQDIHSLNYIHKQLIPLIPKDCAELGITGGEPTLLGELFFELLESLKLNLPNTEVHCLSNGRSFAWSNIAYRLGSLDYKNMMIGIPIYSDFYQIHDYVVQARNAFNQTIKGLYNLAANSVRIEIRIVLQKQSISRLPQLAKYIYRNLPFVEHIAFMGLEHQGYTPFNIEKLWVDPVEYMEKLEEAVLFLSEKRMNVSIYNSQLCLMQKSLWPFNRKSISDWKNTYVSECSICSVNSQCGGFFESTANRTSAYIKAII